MWLLGPKPEEEDMETSSGSVVADVIVTQVVIFRSHGGTNTGKRGVRLRKEHKQRSSFQASFTSQTE